MAITTVLDEAAMMEEITNDVDDQLSGLHLPSILVMPNEAFDELSINGCLIAQLVMHTALVNHCFYALYVHVQSFPKCNVIS